MNAKSCPTCKKPNCGNWAACKRRKEQRAIDADKAMRQLFIDAKSRMMDIAYGLMADEYHNLLDNAATLRPDLEAMHVRATAMETLMSDEVQRAIMRQAAAINLMGYES